MKDEKLEGRRIVYTASIIGALVALLIVIVAARSIFPPIMFQGIVVVLMGLIVFVNGWGMFGEVFVRFVKKTMMAGKHYFLARKYFKEFDRFVDKLGELLEPRRCDNIPYTLNRIQSSEPVFRDILLLTVDDFRDLFVVFRNGIGKLPRNRKMFLMFIECFECLLNSYNRLCICKPVEQIRNILRQRVAEIPEDIKEEYRQHFECLLNSYNRLHICKAVEQIRNILRQRVAEIPEDIKEEYRQQKVAYDKFILEYMDFAKGINKDFGKKVAREWFDMPKGLDL